MPARPKASPSPLLLSPQKAADYFRRVAEHASQARHRQAGLI
jgi:hypothetical protein